jgi:hypothetical protein
MICQLIGIIKEWRKYNKYAESNQKSTKPTAIELSGMSNLGKYTLDTKFELSRILLLIC